MNKILLLTILIIFLDGCQTLAPKVSDTEQCSPVFAENVCKCRMYRFTREGVGPAIGTQTKEHELDYCDKMVGWRVPEYKLVSGFWEQLRVWLLFEEAHQKP